MGYIGNLALVTQVDGYTREDVSDIFVGMVADFGMGTAPDRWLPCDGRAVSRTSYPKLFARLGTTWGAGDGSTTFNVPDLRGFTTTGTGTNDLDIDPGDPSIGKYTGPNVGVLQRDRFQGHWHRVSTSQTAGTDFRVSVISPADRDKDGAYSSSDLSTQALAPISDGTNGTPRTGPTTHGPEAGVLKCIFGGVA